MGGLVDTPAPTGTYHTMGSAPAPNGAVETTVTQAPAEQSVNSHLDSFFASSGWTREDVLVVAAMIQLLAWAILLYEEVGR